MIFLSASVCVCQLENARVGAAATAFFILVLGMLIFPSDSFVPARRVAVGIRRGIE